MTIDTLYASPNDVSFRYSSEYLDYSTVYVFNDRVEVFSEDIGDQYLLTWDLGPENVDKSKAVYPFTKSKDVNVIPKKIAPIILEKNGKNTMYQEPYELGFERKGDRDKINILFKRGEEITLPTVSKTCAIIPKELDWQTKKKSYIDAAGDHLTAEVLKKDSLSNSWTIKSEICKLFQNEKGISSTKSLGGTTLTGSYFDFCSNAMIDYKARLSSNPDVLLSFDFYDEANELDEFRIYYKPNSIGSSRLACILEKNLQEKFKDKKIMIEAADKDILSQTKSVGVLLMLGNVNVAELKNYMPSDYKDVIYKSIREYYE